MKHLILGTAGHVDHGKTALVRALTGIECDTHREEKERGITIHLGFAHLDLPNGDRVGIIDVPGHRDFIHTMVGGAAGIDFVLLVIAADSGVMPQTREHLQIMDVLGIKHGIVVLSRTDLVEADFLDLCEAEVREYLSGTVLKEAPVVRVSAKTGTGLDDLKRTIQRMVETLPSRPSDGIFRMYIDRIFSVTGFGTVVTGTAIGGVLRKTDSVFLLADHPKELKIRRMEQHGAEVAEIRAGDRVSLNLTGLEKAEFRRGMMLADRVLKETYRFDAVLAVHAPHHELGLWSQMVLHAGTAEHQARVHLINKNLLKCGETALVQVHLDSPLFLQQGDRFVIRNTSCDTTIGGGEVIDAAPLHHRRRPERLVTELELMARHKLNELIAAEIRKAQKPLSLTDIAQQLNISPDRVTRVLEEEPLTGVVRWDAPGGAMFTTQIYQDQLRQTVLEAVADFRRRRPLSEKGMALDELRSTVRLDKSTGNDAILLALLARLVEKQKLREVEGTWLLFEDTGKADPKLARSVQVIEKYLAECGMQTPLMNQIKQVAGREGIGEKELNTILYHLTRTGKVLRVENEYLHHSIVDACRRRLIERLGQVPEGLKVSDFRDLVGGNRKICLLLLAQFDAEGTTVREGDVRFRKKTPPTPVGSPVADKTP